MRTSKDFGESAHDASEENAVAVANCNPLSLSNTEYEPLCAICLNTSTSRGNVELRMPRFSAGQLVDLNAVLS